MAFLLWRVRRFLDTGHSRDDLMDVLHIELARQREELAFAYGGRATRLERWLRGMAYAALGACTTSVALGGHDLGSVPDLTPWLGAAMTAAAALLAAVVARLRTEHRTDPGAGRRLAFWRGRRGQWLFHLAGLGRSRKDVPPGGTHTVRRPSRAAAFTPTPTPAPAPNA